MNKRALVAVLLVGLVVLVGVALWMVGVDDGGTTIGPGGGDGAVDVVDPEDVTDPDKAGEDADTAERVARKRVRRSKKWVHRGDGSMVGIVREYGSDRPIGGVKVSLQGDGPNQTLETVAGEDGSFAFDLVPAYDAWTLTVAAPEPLADAVVAGLEVTRNQQADLGIVYLTPGFVVQGVVAEVDGTPIHGALVRAVRATSGPSTPDLMRLIRDIPNDVVSVDEAETDVKGRFALAKLAPGTYDLYVSAAEHQLRVRRSVLVTPEQADKDLRFVLPAGFTLSGRVIREAGGGPEGLAVVAFPEPNGPEGFQSITEKIFATCDADGRFELEGLRPSDWIVTVTPPNAPTTISDDVTVPGTESVEIRISGEAWLEGRITDSKGKPIKGAEVFLVLEGKADAPILGSAESDGDGRYRIEALPVVSVQGFVVRANGYAAYPDDPRALFSNRGPKALTIEAGRNVKDVELVAGGIVKGRIVEEGTDTGVPGVRVSLVSQMSMFAGGKSATTDPKGYFELTGVTKGSGVLTLWKEGWNAVQDPMAGGMGAIFGRGGGGADTGEGPGISLTEPGQVIERTLSVERGAVLSGRVVDPGGKPVAGAQVSFAPPKGMGGMGRMMGAMFGSPEPRLTDSEGRFQLPGARPGQPTVVQVQAAGYRVTHSDPVMVAKGAEPPSIEIKLAVGATLTGKVTAKGKGPVAGVEVRWRAKSDQPQAAFMRDEPTYTGSDGVYTIPNVAAGELSVSFEHARFIDQDAVAVTTVDGKTATRNVTLDAGLAVAGTVMGPDDKPVAGARVTVSGNGVWERVKTDDAGRFEVAGLKPGSYDATASASGLAGAGNPAVQAGGDGVVLRLEQSYSITGTVQFSGGRPVANARVSAEGEGGGRSRSDRTDANGNFDIDELPAGRYALKVEAGWGRPEDRPNVVTTSIDPVQAGTTGVMIEVEEGLVVTGTVTLASGKPADSGWANGHAINADGTRDPSRSARAQGVVTEGRLHVTGLLEGRYRLTVQVGAQARTIEVDAGDTGVRIEFGETGSVTGRVSRADGGPVKGASVRIHGPAGNSWAQVQEDGTYKAEGLSAGRFTVNADLKSKDDGNWTVEQRDVEVTAGGTTGGVDLTMKKAGD